LIIHSNIEWGPKIIQFNIQFKIKSEEFIQLKYSFNIQFKILYKKIGKNTKKLCAFQTLSESL